MGDMLEMLAGGALWGIAFGVAANAVRAIGGGMQPLAHGVRPAVKEAVKGTMKVGDWARGVADEGRETLEDIYNEAKAERSAGR